MHQYVAVAVVALQLALRWGSLAAGAMWPDCQPPFSALQMQCSRWPIYASDAGGQCSSATCNDTLAVGRVSVCVGVIPVAVGATRALLKIVLYIPGITWQWCPWTFFHVVMHCIATKWTDLSTKCNFAMHKGCRGNSSNSH